VPQQQIQDLARGGMASAECNPIMGSKGRSTGAHPGVGQGDKALRS